MRALSIIFMVLASISLILGVIWRIMATRFPIGHVPPQSFLEFTIACLLFVIAASVYMMATKKQ